MDQFSYSLGKFPLYFILVSITNFIPFVYVDVLRLSVYHSAVSWFIYRLLTAIICPFVGYFSDRTENKYGSNLPYLLSLTPFYILIVYCLWDPASFIDVTDPAKLKTYFICMLSIFGVLSSFIVINHAAFLIEQFNETSKKSAVAFSQVMMILGTLCALCIPQYIGHDWIELRKIGIWSVYICTITMVLSFCGSIISYVENRNVEKEQTAINLSENPMDGMMKTLEIPRLRDAIMMYSLASLGITFIGITMPLFIKYNLNTVPMVFFGSSLDSAYQNTVLQVIPYVVAMFSIPVYSSLLSHYEKSRIWLYGIFLVSLYSSLVFFAYDFYSGLLSSIVLGLSLGILLYIPELLMTQETAEMVFEPLYPGTAAVIGTQYFITHLITAVSGPIQKYILTTFGYDPQFHTPTTSLQFGIWLLISILPLMCFSLAYKYIPKVALERKKKIIIVSKER